METDTLGVGRTARPGCRDTRVLCPGVSEREGEIISDAATATDPDPWLPLRVGAMAAEHDLPIDRATLDRLRDLGEVVPTPWPTQARTLFVDLLLAGRPSIGVIEALDHHGVWERLMPEWPTVRARPQHNPYHRFTVDRHLLETVSNASARAGHVERPDLLVLAALLHDLGKGAAGDHTAAGMKIARSVGERVGLQDDDIDTVVSLVRDHLLLNDVASRRDLDDDVTIALVSDAVGSVSQLRLLAALTEADARATGPTAWSSWKAELVSDLVNRVEAHLRGEPIPRARELFRSDEIDLASLAGGGHRILAEGDTVTVVYADRPGVFSRVAGVLAFAGSTSSRRRHTRHPTVKRYLGSASSTGSGTRPRGPQSSKTSNARWRAGWPSSAAGRTGSLAQSTHHRRHQRDRGQ